MFKFRTLKLRRSPGQSSEFPSEIRPDIYSTVGKNLPCKVLSHGGNAARHLPKMIGTEGRDEFQRNYEITGHVVRQRAGCRPYFDSSPQDLRESSRRTARARGDDRDDLKEPVLGSSAAQVCAFVVNRPYAIVSSLVSFWIPGVVMIIMYCKIYKEAVRQRAALSRASSSTVLNNAVNARRSSGSSRHHSRTSHQLLLHPSDASDYGRSPLSYRASAAELNVENGECRVCECAGASRGKQTRREAPRGFVPERKNSRAGNMTTARSRSREIFSAFGGMCGGEWFALDMCLRIIEKLENGLRGGSADGRRKSGEIRLSRSLGLLSRRIS